MEEELTSAVEKNPCLYDKTQHSFKEANEKRKMFGKEHWQLLGWLDDICHHEQGHQII